MKFYDLHVQPVESSIEEIIKTAEQLGYSGVCITAIPENFEKLEKAKSIQSKIELYTGIIISANETDILKKLIDQYREKVDIIIVSGGDYKINRAACENPKVDILAHPERERNDSGLDEACLTAAKKNNVAIEINFKEILNNYRRMRASIMQLNYQNIKLCAEMKAPIILASGALSIWDMRAPRELISVAGILGIELAESFNLMTAVPQTILEKNKKKLDNKIITEGVEIA